MSAGELTEWMAFEQVHGPILMHERVDIGLAQLCTIMARLWGGKRDYRIKDFLPGWYKRTGEDSVTAGFEMLLRMADSPKGDG